MLWQGYRLVNGNRYGILALPTTARGILATMEGQYRLSRTLAYWDLKEAGAQRIGPASSPW